VLIAMAVAKVIGIRSMCMLLISKALLDKLHSVRNKVTEAYVTAL